MPSIAKPQFPRSNAYDPAWVFDNQMGPNALWLAEWLSEAIAFTPGMRVLDLGCGKAMSSIFLAREFGARVWAVDLWIAPHHNWRRACEAGVPDAVCPIRAEAHALPFAHGFFDAAISIDAYPYFGTDDLYLNYLATFVRPGAPIGIVAPGLTRPIDGAPPEWLTRQQASGKPFWEDECRSFHTAEWWATLWRSCSKVEAVESATLPDGWKHWRDWERALEASGKAVFPSDAEALDADAGRTIGLVRVTARRSQEQAIDMYDPAIGVQVGVDK